MFIDWSDGLLTPGFRDEMRACDLVLKCHYNRKDPLPTNFRPWAFGLSTRILDHLSGEGEFGRDADILVNYRHNHSVRKRAGNEIIPLFDGILRENRTVDAFDDVEGMTHKDRLLWVQTGRRHYPAYRRLLASTACSCFGGLLRKDRVYQFDSWRFWELLAAGTCAFHVDLEKYGCVFPVMPVNMMHYLGFNLENPACIVDSVRRNPALLKRIGEMGRGLGSSELFAPASGGTVSGVGRMMLTNSTTSEFKVLTRSRNAEVTTHDRILNRAEREAAWI